MYAHMYAHMTDEADGKQKGLGKVKEGKSKMCPRLYEELGTFFHEEDMQETQYCNSQSWNLMCRHFNVDGVCATHVGFTVDAMTIECGKTKNQSTGGGTNMTSMLKHVHANPFKPWVSTFTPHIRPHFRPHFFRPHFHPHFRPHFRPHFTPTPG